MDRSAQEPEVALTLRVVYKYSAFCVLRRNDWEGVEVVVEGYFMNGSLV